MRLGAGVFSVPRAGGEHRGIVGTARPIDGSSPRGRGTQPEHAQEARGRRIIPARAGNTRPRGPARAPEPDHPRAGGEHTGLTALPELPSGSSPRGRGTHPGRGHDCVTRRIIPARAGNTGKMATGSGPSPDHPRAGGEHRCARACASRCIGSSPRGRGTLRRPVRRTPRSRIIPARAGNTTTIAGRSPTPSDHPRAGGEHLTRLPGRVRIIGSSPRGRGTPADKIGELRLGRIIPARAGNTDSRCGENILTADHPRAGGEHHHHLFPAISRSGSSPRGRGTPDLDQGRGRACRIIPARAGNTRDSPARRTGQSDHPRAGGEHLKGEEHELVEDGSSPRGRGTRRTR